MRALAALLLLVALASGARAEGAWTGHWETRSSGGSTLLRLQQDGAAVTGHDVLTGDRLEGRSEAEVFVGDLVAGDVASRVTLRLSRDGSTFTGRQPDGGWWIGTRTAPGTAGVPGSRNSPGDALRQFLYAATTARDHAPLAWIFAVDALDFSEAGGDLSPGRRVEMAQDFFRVLDLTTPRFTEIARQPPGDEAAVVLRQSGSNAQMTLRLRRDRAGRWQLVVPAQAELAALRATLTAARGGRLPEAGAFRNRASPRDAMRAFLDAMTRWEQGGRAAALAAMDLSNLAPVSKASDGAIVAHTLRRALDRIGLDALQSLPDDGGGDEPFVVFAHPAGRIVLVPVGTGQGRSWVFAAETVDAIVPILRVAEQLSPPEFRPPGSIPPSTFFQLRELVTLHAPALLKPLKRFEAWQVLGILLSLGVAVMMGAAASAIICALLQRLVPEEGRQPTWFRIGFAVSITVAIGSVVPIIFGVPAQARRYALPVVGSVVILTAAMSAWHLLRIICDRLARLVAGTVTRIDDIIVSFMLAVLRAAIVIGAGLGIANLFAFSTSSILAGLGIGGLAIAFASRETLSNVFGAAILMTDRPFGRGDWINVGDVAGVVDHVGIRSTRVQNPNGEIVTVPNGRLADSSIINRGRDRSRQIAAELLVTGGATPERLTAFADDLRARLASDPSLEPAAATVRITGLSSAGVEIRLSTLARPEAAQAAGALREALLLDFMTLAEARNLSLAGGRA